DPLDRLFLQAILHRADNVAARAWEAVRGRIDLDAPTQARYRLYPMLADRLGATAPEQPCLGMLRGIRRRATVRTMLQLRQLDDVLALLYTQDIEAVALKGAALALANYEHVGQRPFEDFDLLVAPSRHAEAVELLEAQGWTRMAADFPGNRAVGLIAP